MLKSYTITSSRALQTCATDYVKVVLCIKAKTRPYPSYMFFHNSLVFLNITYKAKRAPKYFILRLNFSLIFYTVTYCHLY